MLKVDYLSKSYGAKVLLNKVSFSVSSGIKGGLVGVNGSGKSTLLKILAGEDNDYEGKVTYTHKYPLIGYMNQLITLENQDITILEFLKRYTGLEQIEKEVAELMEHLHTNENIEKYGDMYELFERMGGYNFDHLAETVLQKLGLGKYTMEKTIVKELSGGEKNKLLLGGTLLKGGDLLLLDEPTNNLDKRSIKGLVDLIQNSLTTCLIVSHDKEFLNQIVKKIYELDEGNISEYTGGYTFYEQQKVLQYEQQMLAHQRQLEEFERLNNTQNQLEQKARNIAFKGNTRDNDKGDGASKAVKKLTRQSHNLEARMKRAEKVKKPKQRAPLEIILDPQELPTGGIKIQNLQFNYIDNTDFTLKIPDIEITSVDKVIIQGENGEGKSTFLKLLINSLQPVNGSISIHPSIRISYFAQEQNDLPPNLSPIDFLQSQGQYLLDEVNYVLSKIGFDKEEREKPIYLLSPGMKSRLVFASISLKKANCLIFDEPTNHVDLETVEQLKESINAFNGIIIVVSHDESFINDLTFTKIIEFKNGYGKEMDPYVK